MTTNDFEFVDFTTADELLAAIAPFPRLKTETPTPRFIFRGQREATWRLLPTALRQDEAGVTKAAALIGERAPVPAEWQVLAEFELLHAFISACDRAVIPLPGDGPAFRAMWMDDQRGKMAQTYRAPARWPHPEHYEALAFAQHHGVPTRLLDWSLSGVVAAYFAAAEAVKNSRDHQRDHRLAVWALNVEFLHVYERVVLVQLPGANSLRLGAQRGLFTLVRGDQASGQPIDDRTIDQVLVSPYEDTSKPKPLWKLTLPQTEAARLLYLCHLLGVDGSSVYPGPTGAAEATLELMVWTRSDPDTAVSPMGLRPVGVVDIVSHRRRT